MKKFISRWFTLQPDKKLENFYFKGNEDGEDIFYPLGQPGKGYHINEQQKKKFINLFTFVLILSMLLIASLIYPFEISKNISLFGIFVIALNADLVVRFVIPLLYARLNDLNIYQKNIAKPKVIKVISRSVLMQYFFILMGLVLNSHIYFLWCSLGLLTIFSLFIFLINLKKKILL